MTAARLWNSYGTAGNNDLLPLFLAAKNITESLENGIAAVMAVLATKLNYAIQLDAVTARPVFKATIRNATATYQVCGLSMCHLSIQLAVFRLAPTQLQLAWLTAPILLLILCLILLGYRIAHPNLGGIDFTDPIQVLLVSLTLPPAGNWAYCSTGKFADRREYHAKRVYFGVPRDYYNPHGVGVPAGVFSESDRTSAYPVKGQWMI